MKKVILMIVGSLLTIMGCHIGTVHNSTGLDVAEDNNGSNNVPSPIVINKETASHFIAFSYSEMIKDAPKNREPYEVVIIQMQDDIIETLKKEFKLDFRVMAQMKLGILEVLSAQSKLDKLAIIQMQLGVTKVLQEHFKLDGATIIHILQDITRVLQANSDLTLSTIPQMRNGIIKPLQKGLKKVPVKNDRAQP